MAGKSKLNVTPTTVDLLRRVVGRARARGGKPGGGGWWPWTNPSEESVTDLNPPLLHPSCVFVFQPVEVSMEEEEEEEDPEAVCYLRGVHMSPYKVSQRASQP